MTPYSGRENITTYTDYNIRPVDTARDMPAVLDLIELGFRKELDPQGWKMLHQMRRLSQSHALARVVYTSGSTTPGFVCIADGAIVGNLSLRHAAPRRFSGRMIGNVVVHPEYRKQGIGRALMEHGIAEARRQGAAWVGLEVRADNEVACNLYTRLGFRAVGIMKHMLRPPGLPWPDSKPISLAWRKSKPRDSDLWQQLAVLMHSDEQRLILEIASQQHLYGGWERQLSKWLSGQAEKAWVLNTPGDEIAMAIRVQADRRFKFLIWDLLLNPSCTQQETKEMILQCLEGSRRFPHWPVAAMVPEHGALLQCLDQIGFQKHRTLQQMLLEF